MAAASARPVVLDTTVLIARLRRGAPLVSRATRRGYVSVVALAEVLAGARSRREAQECAAYEAAAVLTGRLLVPNAADWHTAGQLLERRGRLEGALHPRDHLADLLIVLSAAQIGGCVLTRNVSHLEAWARLARRSGRDVVVAADT